MKVLTAGVSRKPSAPLPGRHRQVQILQWDRVQTAGPASHAVQTAETGKHLAVVVDALPAHDGKRARMPELPDGNAAERITQVLPKWPQQLRERLPAAR